MRSEREESEPPFASSEVSSAIQDGTSYCISDNPLFHPISSLWKSNPEESHPYIQIQRSSSKILSDTWTFGFSICSISKHRNHIQKSLEISIHFSFQCPKFSRHFQAVVSLHGKVSISRPCPKTAVPYGAPWMLGCHCWEFRESDWNTLW